MSYGSRQKKRAIKAAQAEHRETIMQRYYRTLVSRACSCNGCGGALRDGNECVYRHTPREVLCVLCAESRGVSWRPSVAWERARRRQRRSGR